MAIARGYHGCGSFNLESNLVLIVAGSSESANQKSVEFLVPSDDEPEWISGKKSFFYSCIVSVLSMSYS